MKLRVLFLAALMALAAFAVPAMAQQSTFIDPAIKEHLQKADEVDLLIHMRERADLSAAFGMSWEERGQFVYDELTTLAKHSQADLLDKLNQLEGNYDSYQSFWISNVVIVNGANNTLFEAVSSREDFKALTVAPVYSLPVPIENSSTDDVENQLMAGIATNIEQIRAPEAWAEGVTGEGVVVAIIDSGTRYSHEALVNQYRGNIGGGNFDHNYNWFDIAGTTEPQWPNPHGSHVTGTAVGDNGTDEQIGVAPGADWISCLGCTSNGCPSSNLLACAEFVAAPTDLGGNNPEPDLRAHVVNNSWGDCGQSYDGWYQDSVDAWIAAGVIPVAANGNASNCGYSSPPGLNTVGNPGRYGSVLGIGSSGNNNGEYAPHSNWGPTDNPNDGSDPTLPDPRGYFDLKPNVIAPGVNIWSVNSASDTGYTSAGFSGTSMSAPAATGTIALMLSAAENLKGDYATIGTLLMETANPVPYDSGTGDEGPGMVPNYATGWGEIDAYSAVQAAIAASGPRGTLAGNVTDDSTGLPIKDAAVNASNAEEDQSGSTDSSGDYSLGLAEGTYEVEFTAFGYQSVTETGVGVDEGQTTTLNISMAAADSHEVSGTVTDSVTGWPLHAAINIDGYPGGTLYTDPADGSYEVSLPEGMGFEFTVTAIADGYDFTTENVGPLTGDSIQDFELDADQSSCEAPGYDNSSNTLLSETFDDTSTPSGWSVEDLGNSNGLWVFDDPGNRGNLTGGDGGFAIIDSDHNGSGGDQDTAMVTPSMDLSSAISAELRFNHDFYDFSGSSGSVDVSTDGGATWESVWSIEGTSDRGPKMISASLHDFVGESDVQVRWRYQGSWDWYWQVDDVEVVEFSTCEPQTGELVHGVVSDANSGQPLNDATVEVDGTSFSTTTGPNPDLGDGAYSLFVPEGSQEVIASLDGYGDAKESDTFVDGEIRRLDLALESGHLNVMPEQLSSTVTFGDTREEALILINDGTADVNVDLSVVAGFEEHFEGDFPPAEWAVEDLGGSDCLWMTNADYGKPNHAGGDGLSAAADADSCGILTWLDTALVSPEFPVAAGSQLNFVLSFRAYQQDEFRVDITTDGGDTWSTLQSWTSSVDAQGPGASQSIALGAYQGQTAQVRFVFQSDWGYWAQVDQVEITGEADWLSVTPDSGLFGDGTGAVPMYESLNTTVTFDASAPSITEPGTYSAAILVENDTPQGDIVIPVEMVVEPNADQAEIAGTITSLGFCDDDPQPLAGADVEIIGASSSYTLTSDENGEYAMWLDANESPIAIAVQAADHVDRTIVDVQLAGGTTTTENIELRLDAACPSVNPDSISASHEPNETSSHSITLSNSGTADLEWDTGTAPALSFISSDGAGRTATGQARAISGSALDVRSLYEDDMPTIAGYHRITAIDCETGDFLVVHDGGTIDNGYSANADVVDMVSFVEYYEPAQYPALIGEVCVSFISLNTSAVDQAFELIVVADDGPDGAPGTELGSVSAVAENIPGGGLPDSTPWFTVDLASLGLTLESGGIYIGVRYDPGTPDSVFIASDESSAQQVGFWMPDNDWVEMTSDGYDDYKALFIRPQMMPATGCVDPEDIDWLSVSPVSGTTAAGGSSTITVDIDTAGMLPGDYEAEVCIFTDESRASVIGVPVTLTVEVPEHYGFIEGHVDSLGYCSDNQHPAEGATVVVNGQSESWTVATDTSGDFVLAIDEAQSPVEIAVSLTDHFDVTESGVIVDAGSTTTLDYELELDASCAEATPDALGLILDRGDSGTDTLSLANHGAGDLDWSAFHSETTTSSLVFGGTGGNEGAGVAASHPDDADDVRSNSLYQGEMPALEMFNGMTAIDCDNAPDLVIHDSGNIDNGYSANAETVSEVSFVELFEPGIYPAELGEVCVAFISLKQVPADQVFEMIVYADDGPNGAPGTELGAVTATAEDIPGGGLPPSVPWVTVDLSSLDITITTGGVYVGVRFDPADPDEIFIASDESSAPQVGYWRPVSDTGDAWEPIEGAYEEYSALMIRPQMPPATGCLNPEAVPWLTVDPADGTVAPQGSTDINVTADTAILAPGQYEVMVCIESNDPQKPMIEVPFELTVEPTADDAEISGTIGSLGQCDSNPEVLAGAEITIDTGSDSYALTSGENGEYSLWLDISNSPVDITVVAEGHVDEVVTGVALTSGSTTVEDIDLRLATACPDVNPDSLSASQEPDETSTHVITLANNGAADLGWETDATVIGQTFISSDGAGRMASGQARAMADSALDVRSLYKDDVPTIAGYHRITAIDCETGDFLVVHDGGTIDNGYSANADVVDMVSFVEYYEPAQYPALIGEVCVSFVSLNTSAVDQAFELIVVADDGPDGAPGTELGSVSAVAENIPGGGVPSSTPWFTVDLTSLGLTLESGGIYIGVRFDPGTPDSVFIASDESSAQQVGFWMPDNDWVEMTSGDYDEYKALFVRPQMIPQGCANPEEVDWLSVSPGSGTTAGDDSTDINVDIDTTGMLPGEYEAEVCIFTDAPGASIINVPVSLTVEKPESYGDIEGHVDSLGHCSADAEPAAGAMIEIAGQSGSWTVTTDANGDFSLSIDAAEAPADITVSLDGHHSVIETGVGVEAGETTLLSFELELDAGCANVDPAGFSLTIRPNDSMQHTDALTINNGGAGELVWGLYSSTADSCESIEPASWLSVDPDEGTTDAGDSAEVDVNVDADGLEPGVYEALICLDSDDAENPLIGIPYQLEVLGDGIFQDRFEP